MTIDFLAKFLLTNIVFSSIIFSFFATFFKKKEISVIETFVYSLGLGPIFTALILYWMILLFPHKSNLFYISSVFAFYGLLSTSVIAYCFKQKNEIKENISNLFLTIKNLFKDKKKLLIQGTLSLLLIAVCSVTLVNYSNIYLKNPLEGHDVLVYGTEGKIYYNDKSFKAKFKAYDPKSGFSYFSLHAPSFPLQYTWEKLCNSFLNSDTDSYFKSLSPFYGFLICLTTFTLLRRKSLSLAIITTLALFSGFHFFLSFFKYHIDLFRIYFLMLSWIFLGYSVEKKDRFSLILFGITSGFTAFTHSLGAMIAGFNALALFLFMNSSWSHRTKYFILSLFLIFIFGGSFYLLDILYGKGWILNVIS